ncbi:MAG: FHA domain-containing protein [Myxococcaceae bacterium]
MASDNRPSRGGGNVDDDPERQQGTRASMKRPAVSRGGGNAEEDDPERNAGTRQNMKRSSASTSLPVQRGGGDGDADPERNQSTQARAKMPQRGSRGGSAEGDPERNQGTQARAKQPRRRSSGAGEDQDWEAPPGRDSREQRAGGERYSTGSAYNNMQEDNDYQTGNEYKPLSEEDLEGDGLSALDADLGPGRTTALPQSNEPEDGDGDGDDDEEDESNQTNAGRPLKLEIVAGPDAGKKKKFKGVRMKVGRTAGVDLLLKDQSVSRIHFEMVVGDKGVLLRDLGSGNGTKVNGEKVLEKLLEHGDEIHIGKTKIKFVDELAAFQKAQEDAEKKKEEKAAEAKAAEEKKEGEEKKEAEGGEEKKEGEGGEAEAKEGEEKAEGEGAAAEEGDEKSGTKERPKVARRRQAEAPQGLVAKFKALPKQKQLIFGGGAGVGVFLLLLIMISALSKPPPPKEDPRKAQAQAKMQTARDAVRAGKYDEAVAAVEEAEKLFPGIDSTHLGSQARDEMAVMRGIDAVRTLIGQERFDDARTELARIPKGSNKAEEQKKTVEEELKLAEAKYKRGKVEELLATGDVESAKQLFAELPDADQRELAPRIAEAEEAIEKQKKDQEAAERRGQIAGANAAHAHHEEEIQLAFAVVTRKFRGQEWERAASECDRVVDAHPGDAEIRTRAKQLQSLIPSFGRYYEEGKKKYQQGQLALAARPLSKALSALEQTGLPGGNLRDELSDMLQESSIVAAKDALLRDDIASAAVALRSALKLDPSNTRAKDLLHQVEGKAEDLYQEAYMLKDRDPREAVRKFKAVVEATPPGSTVREKAQNQINNMPQ